MDDRKKDTIELLVGDSNWVDDAKVFVLSSTEDTIDLGVYHGGDDVPLHRYKEGEHIPIGGSNWAILDIFPTGDQNQLFPGIGNQKVAARIRRLPARD